MYQPIVPCQALNQISQPYGFNNQQRGFDQGFNQGRGYSQGYNLGGAQGPTRGGFNNNYQRYTRNNVYRKQPQDQQQQLQAAMPAPNANASPAPTVPVAQVPNHISPTTRPYNGPAGAGAPNHYVSGSYEQHYQQPGGRINYNRCPYNGRPLPESQQIAYNGDIYRESIYSGSNGKVYYGSESDYNSRAASPEAYATVPPGGYELQGQGYNQHLQPNAYQDAYVNRSPVSYDNGEYPEDHEEANAQFVTENAVEPFSKGSQDCKPASSPVPSDNAPCSGNGYSTTLVESDASQNHQPGYGF